MAVLLLLRLHYGGRTTFNSTLLAEWRIGTDSILVGRTNRLRRCFLSHSVLSYDEWASKSDLLVARR